MPILLIRVVGTPFAKNLEMKHIKTGKSRAFFKILAGSRAVQAALMVLRSGQDTGPPQNEHSRAEQWLFVVKGRGRARVNKRRVNLRANSLLLIEKGEVHQISNIGKAPLVTINFYAPPAYTKGGEVKESATYR